MNANLKHEANWLKHYLSALIDGRIVAVDVEIVDEDDAWPQAWPVIYIKKEGELFRCEISQDQEGNGPGFVFGLPQVDGTKLDTFQRDKEDN